MDNLELAFAQIRRLNLRDKKPCIHWNGTHWGVTTTGFISEEVARAAWDNIGSVQWSQAGHAEMSRIVMAESCGLNPHPHAA